MVLIRSGGQLNNSIPNESEGNLPTSRRLSRGNKAEKGSWPRISSPHSRRESRLISFYSGRPSEKMLVFKPVYIWEISDAQWKNH